jgi:CTP:molybdopterin cytidylyltransferase MocA/xanthine/CO dehydrogenase XdhC/CoxF family maturation factor
MRRDTLRQLLEARGSGQVLVRALDITSGAEKLINPQTDRSPLGRAAAEAAKTGLSTRTSVDGTDWFLSVYGQADEIVIVGAVHIAQALAALASAAGYRVRVIDPRAAYATQARFPGIMLQRLWPDEALKEQPLGARSALIALAHDPRLDDAALAQAVRSPAFYVGALGSTRTHMRRLARLDASGFSAAELSRIHGPVGLSIGARSPTEIAIAILAQLVQIRRTAKRPRIAAILLAAGRSTRMGANKLSLPFKGKPLVRHASDAALAAGLDPVIVVTGHEPEMVHQALAGTPVRFIHNSRHAEGLSSSLQAGARSVPSDCDGALILLGDMPNITPQLIKQMVCAYDPANGRAICVATANGRRGHPVLWDRRFLTDMESLTGDAGAKSLMQSHAELVWEVESHSNAPLTDIDTPEALARFSNDQAV